MIKTDMCLVENKVVTEYDAVNYFFTEKLLFLR